MYLNFNKNIDHSNLVLSFLAEFSGVCILRATELPTEPFQIALGQNSSSPILFSYCCGNYYKPSDLKQCKFINLQLWESDVENESTGLCFFWRLQGRIFP